MTTYKTGNPLGSAAAKDIYDNAQNLDFLVNDRENESHPDRFGVDRKTWYGMQQMFVRAMAKMGWVPFGTFEAGATLTDATQSLKYEADGNYYRWDGDFPKTVPASSSPESTGGVVQGAWVNVTDMTLRSALAGAGGAAMLGASSGKNVQEEIDSTHQDVSSINALIKSNFISHVTPSVVPASTNDVKAVMKITGSPDFYIISKKSNGKSGYVSMRVTNTVSDADAENYGGASPFRLGSVDNIVTALTAKLVPSAKSAGVVLSTLTTAQIATVYGFTASGGGSINASLATGDFSLSSPQIYSVPNTDSVTYQVTQKKAKIRFARTNASSQIVNIYTSINGTDWVLSKTLTTQLPPSGTVRGYNVEIDGITVSTWYLKVENAHANPAYVAGLNIEPIDGDFIYDYDQFIGTLSAALPSGVSYYLGGLGANEFAAKEKSTGKFFGTYHGGHEGFLQRFRTDSASYNLDSSTAPVLLLTKHALLHSASTLRVSSTLYSYVASTQFGDGVAITNYAIKLGSGTPILCERIYTHMCTSARTFNWIHLPIAINKEDDGDVLLGQTGMIQQYRAEDAVTINCYFSQLNLSQNGNGGAYVSFQPNYNKQYYGPALGSTVGYPIVEGTFTTAKEFF